MQEFEVPNVLDPTRPRLEGTLSMQEASAEIEHLRRVLTDACEYGQALWREVDLLRHHLLAMLPEPDSDDDLVAGLTAPRGPEDADGWSAWETAYATATSALAGPRGDSGFGRHEAGREAMARQGAAHHSHRSSQLVDLATERRVRVAEQHGPGLASLPTDPAHDASGAGHPGTGPAAVARPVPDLATEGEQRPAAATPAAASTEAAAPPAGSAIAASPVVLAAFGAGFAAGAVAGRLSRRPGGGRDDD